MSTEDPVSKTSADDPVLRWIGNFGKWQAKTIGIVQFVGLFTGWNMLSSSFLLPAGVSHWCSPPHFSVNPNISAMKNTQLFLQTDNNSLFANNSLVEPKSIEDKNRLQDTNSRQENIMLYTNNSFMADTCKVKKFKLGEVEASTEACSNWEYDRTTYPQTVISEFNLVCNNEYLISLSQSIYMFGVMVGSVGSGILSDKYGRKLMILTSSWLSVLFGVVASQSWNIFAFIVFRWCLAVCTSSTFICGYVYCVEIVGGRWATLVGSGLMFPWALGYMTIPMLAWLFPIWRHLQLAITLPIILFIIPVSVPSLVPESPRWMLVRGKANQATAILASAAIMNHRKMPIKSDPGETVSTFLPAVPVIEKSSPVAPVTEKTPPLAPISEKPSRVAPVNEKSSVMDLFRSRRLCIRTLIMFYIWFTNSFIYYGLTLNSGSLIPGDLHTNFIIGGILEVGAYSLTILALIHLGRRWSLSGTMVFGGVALLLTTVVPNVVGKTISAQIGKFLITGSFSMMFVYAAELFPTVVRNVGVGSCSMFARIGGMLAPYIGKELGLLSKDAPIVIYGLTALVAGLLVTLLPETKDRILPDTIEEGENFGENVLL